MNLTTLVFYDSLELSKSDVDSFMSKLNTSTGVECKAINFSSSILDDLLIVSKYRVVSIPTIIVLNKKRAILRLLKPLNDETIKSITSIMEMI